MMRSSRPVACWSLCEAGAGFFLINEVETRMNGNKVDNKATGTDSRNEVIMEEMEEQKKDKRKREDESSIFEQFVVLRRCISCGPYFLSF